MNLTLDAESAQRIQREIARAHDREPAEVVARALSLLEADEAWAEQDKTDLNQRLAASMAQADGGELYTGEEARQLLAEDALRGNRQRQPRPNAGYFVLSSKRTPLAWGQGRYA